LLDEVERMELLATLRIRFERNMARHAGLSWEHVQQRIEANESALWSLYEMERTGGEPDVIGYDDAEDKYVFCDCAPESPKERRSICYDRIALNARKENKPRDAAVDMAKDMGIELLTEAEYRQLQQLGDFDTKTSSWIVTPANIRELGGALFGDRRYGTVFVYHNGAESYYSARGFRGLLRV